VRLFVFKGLQRGRYNILKIISAMIMLKGKKKQFDQYSELLFLI
jgi:hypothetical protein